MFGGMCLDSSASGVLVCWHAEAPWALAIRDCKNLAWALIREWALSISAAKTSTWALTWECALA